MPTINPVGKKRKKQKKKKKYLKSKKKKKKFQACTAACVRGFQKRSGQLTPVGVKNKIKIRPVVGSL